MKTQTEATTSCLIQKNFITKELEFDFKSRESDLSDYNFTKLLGQGTYALVRLATHKKTKKKLAVKIYEKVKLLDPRKYRNVKVRDKIRPGKLMIFRMRSGI